MTSASSPRSRNRRRYMIGSVAAMSALLGTAAPAFADSGAPTGTMKADYTVNSDSSVTVAISGQWDWTSRSNCDSRYGAGYEAVWGDAKSPGYPVKDKAGHTWLVGSRDANGEIVKYDAAHPCGTAPANSSPMGNWNLTHTYQSVNDLPANICVNIYDLHYPYGVDSHGVPKSDYLVDKNGDNSIHNGLVDFNDPATCIAVDRNQVPMGALGALGLAGVAGAGLVVTTARRRRNRRSPEATTEA